MFEHPYLAYRATEYDQEQMQRALERRRFLAEHADQIVPRPAGPARRMWERMLRRMPRPSAAPRDAAAPVDRAAAPCEPAVAR